MRRGFKAEAERISGRVREEMGLQESSPLKASDLAVHVGAVVRPATELTSLEKLQKLEELQPGAFSACTFTIDSSHVIVFNPLNNPGRTESDIAHEVAHLLLDHDVKDVHQIGEISFFSCDPEEEEEANWLAGCLLLPRQLLLDAVRRGLDAEGIAEVFGVSPQMAAFRVRTTGVLRQVDAGKRR